MENPFWDYSLTQYRHTGVQGICLQLQDDFGLDVNMLLYAAWLASQGHVLTAEHLKAIEAATCEWRAEVVVPLRQLRRGLKPVAGADGIRDRVAELELAAEQQQQALLYACYETAGLTHDSGASLAANLHLVGVQTCPGHQSWRPLITRLEVALAS